MKRLVFVTIIALILGFSPLAHAALLDRGPDTLGNHLIYDTDLDLTWYDATPVLMTWSAATDWAATLGVPVHGTTVTGWRLPTTQGYNPNYTDEGEMGHLYYDKLHNDAGGPLANKAPFTNLQSYYYWAAAADRTEECLQALAGEAKLS